MLGPFDIVALLLTFAAAFGFINGRWLGLPHTIAVFLLGLAVALAATVLDLVVPALGLEPWLSGLAQRTDLPGLLLDGFLAILLFTAAVNQDLPDLLRRKWTILTLATLGVVLSTAVLGCAMWLIFTAVGQPVPLVWCLVLGAAVSPTDPVAVHGALGRLPVPQGLKSLVSGESLFNDGAGVVVFTALLALATGGERLTPADVAVGFAAEAAGGGLLGLVAGWLAYQAKRRIDDSTVELTISLALAMATYALAGALQVSGPIAVVVAGLLIGHKSDRHVSSEESRRDLTVFWAMIDSLLNSVLFLVIGLEAAVLISWTRPAVAAALLAIPVALLARLLSLTPALLMHLGAAQKGATLVLLTWAGLRGGVAVALVLTLPPSPYRDPVLGVCYAIVAFTILVQGLTLERVARRAFRSDAADS